jgi:hypothetical protein
VLDLAIDCTRFATFFDRQHPTVVAWMWLHPFLWTRLINTSTKE